MKNINSDEARKLIEENRENSNFIILDVRTAEEFAEQHLAGALNIDIRQEDFEEKIGPLDKDKTYLLHCKAGGRCTRAGQIMEERGFAKIYNVNDVMFK